MTKIATITAREGFSSYEMEGVCTALAATATRVGGRGGCTKPNQSEVREAVSRM